ncbi:unknown [Clostridium sp. CAG:1024]|nr:unknown [Clostridium sp. CAG:1024]
MVARDHNGANARLAALVDRRLDLGTNGVDHAAQTDEHELLFKRFGRGIRGHDLIAAACGAKHTQRLACHGAVCFFDLGFRFRRHRQDGTVFIIGRAARQHDVRRTFGVLHDPFVGFVQRGHHLAHTVERRFAHARGRLLKRGFYKTLRCCKVHERAFCGLADRFAAFIRRSVRAEAHGARKEQSVVRVGLDDRHFVLRKRAGLVRTDDLCAAERFHRCKPANDRIALGHVGHADGEHDRNDRNKSLRDRSDRKADRDHKAVQDTLAGEGAFADKSHGKNHDADDEHEPRQDLRQLRELDLERRLPLLRFRKRACDLAHLGVHARAGDDRLAASVDHGAAHVDHVFAVAERDVLAAELFRTLVDGDAFARERRFFDLKRGGLDHAAVSRHGVARFEQYNVAQDELFVFDTAHKSVPQHAAGRSRHLLKRFDRLFRLALLVYAEDSVDNDDGKDDDNVRKALSLVYGGNAGDHGGRNENEGHRILHLLKEPNDQRRFFCFGQLIRAMRGKSVPGFL